MKSEHSSNLQPGEQINRRNCLRGGVASTLALVACGSAIRPCTTAPDKTANDFGLVDLRPEERRFLTYWSHDGPHGKSRRIMRGHCAKSRQLAFLAWNANLADGNAKVTPPEAEWPWKTQGLFHRRLYEALHQFRLNGLQRQAPRTDITAAVGFRPEELHFGLASYLEALEFDCSFMEFDRYSRSMIDRDIMPIRRLVTVAFGSYCRDALIDIGLAVLHALGLKQFEAWALPAPPQPTAVPWKSEEALNQRVKDVEDYLLQQAGFKRT